jgi:uncharacterized repeat protein (TIGR03843 family)
MSSRKWLSAMSHLDREWIEHSIEVATQGELEITGRLVDASNATLFGTVSLGSERFEVIYKPVAGERPLWDFPDGTLADREYAAFLLSDLCGFNLVPPTILREGPAGFGMVQRWIDIDESINLAEFFSQDLPALRDLALFDAIINNTDRKIGHLLPSIDGHLFACDHGVTFHVQDKLRTVLWQWAGDALTADEIVQLKLTEQLVSENLHLFTAHITSFEYQHLQTRILRLIDEAKMPTPSDDWPPIPWPAY